MTNAAVWQSRVQATRSITVNYMPSPHLYSVKSMYEFVQISFLNYLNCIKMLDCIVPLAFAFLQTHEVSPGDQLIYHSLSIDNYHDASQ